MNDNAAGALSNHNRTDGVRGSTIHLTRANGASKRILQTVFVIGFSVLNVGCVGAILGAAVDTTIEVAKVPFKVGAAVIDVATGDDDD